MADVRGLQLGFPLGWITNTPSASNVVLDANTEKLAFVFECPEAATLVGGSFRYGARTGTPPTYRLSLQGVDASGNPDGTVKGGGSPASVTFTPPADATWDGTWRELTFANSYAAARGERLALVIDYSAGTIDASNNSSFTRNFTQLMATLHGFPYGIQDITGSYARQVGLPTFSVRSASQEYGFPGITFNSLNNTVSGHRQALRFLLPGAAGDTFQVAGFEMAGRISGSTNFKIGIWRASDGVEMVSTSRDGDQVGSTGNNIIFRFLFDSLVTLSYGEAYYAGIECGTGYAVFQVLTVEVNAANQMKALPGGDGWYAATYNGAAWSEATTKRPTLHLILADMTEPSAGGGGSVFGGAVVR